MEIPETIKELKVFFNGVEIEGRIVQLSRLHFQVEITKPYEGVGKGIFEPFAADQKSYILGNEGQKAANFLLTNIYQICHSICQNVKKLKQELEWHDMETCDMIIDLEMARKRLIHILGKLNQMNPNSDELKESAMLRREIMKKNSIISEMANARLSKHIATKPFISQDIIDFIRKI
jgi:hypothetical protein